MYNLIDISQPIDFRQAPRRLVAWRSDPRLSWPACLGALALAAGLGGCARGPEMLPNDLEAALQSGNQSAVFELITANSRPYLAALSSARGKAGVGLGTITQPTVIKTISPSGTRMVLEVGAGAMVRDWVLVREGGRWRLDLNETAVRRPWNLP